MIKRRIFSAMAILGMTVVMALPVAPTSANAAGPCDYYAWRFWGAMAANHPNEAGSWYSTWLSCTIVMITS